MDQVRQLLDRIRSTGVQLWTTDGRLRFRPSGGLDPALAVELRRYKGEVIDLLLEEQPGRDTPLRRVERSRSLPLSHTQEGLWFLEELGHEGPNYNAVVPLRIDGPLDVEALRGAVEDIVRRHESLRTRFRTVNGLPTQVVTDRPARFEVSETTSLEAVWRKHATYRFDLENEDLFRIEVIRLGPTEHVVIVNAHHLLYDGTSSHIFFRELGELYEARRRGLPSPLPDLPGQYADFALWQRGQGHMTGQLAYWKRQLAGASTDLALPIDYPRPRVPDLTGRHRGFQIPQDMADRLTALAGGHNATLAMLLFAAYGALLSRWTGQSDISVGMPIDSRPHADAQHLIGHFLNTVVIRARVAPHLAFTELLGAVKTSLLEAYQHRDLPLHVLVAELAPDRGAGWSQPLFQAMFSHRIQEEPRLGDLAVSVLDLDGPTAKFELTLFAMETPDGVDCSIEYATTLFAPETIDRLAERYLGLLRAVLDRPATPIAELPMLTNGEYACLVERWNATDTDLGTGGCLHELFEAMADQDPDRTAVVFEGRSLSYDDLERRANQIAHRLRSYGVGPERPVAVRSERSLHLLPCLLGVLKAGAPYVPVDPDHPAERQRFMISNSGATVLLSPSEPGQLPVGVRYLPPVADGWPSDRLPRSAVPDNLAYIIHTSGSSGQPKGVGVSHRTIVNRIAAMQWAYALGPDEAVLQKTPTTFDVSVWELFWPLASGARLVLAAPGGQRDPHYLCDLMNREGITTAHFVPSMLATFLADAFPDGRPGLSRVICSGEELPLPLASRFAELFPGCELVNHYGPTEATIECSAWVFAGDEQGRVPIGRPTPNVRLYVLDDQMEPAPIGVVGELHIGGVQLARGYQNQPGLTAERFVPDPYGPPGSRLYRSGDLVRTRNDGALEFLGRLDDQVKIRGHRIEPGEIESTARTCPGVRDAAVVVRERESGDRHLVAYVVGGEIEAVRRHLRERLPSHLVPSAILPLDALPLTSSGKLDRRGLPAPSFAVSGAVPPRTAREAEIAAVWAEVLGLEGVGVHDDFFVLGGHSLLAARAVAEIRRRLGVGLPLREFYSRPTIADLAALTAAEDTIGAVDPLLPLTPPGCFVIFVFPAAGMGPSAFREWRGQAPEGVQLVAVNLPGREGRFGEEPWTHIEPLAFRITEAVEGYSDRPYALFGHSVGGLIAREVARRAVRKPELLAVAASRTPGRPSAADEPAPTDEELLGNLVRWGRVTPEVLADPSHASILLRPLRGDLSVAASCRKPLRPEEIVDVPTVAFAGTSDDVVSFDDCREWGGWTSADFTVHEVEGDHFFPLAAGGLLMRMIAERAAHRGDGPDCRGRVSGES